MVIEDPLDFNMLLGWDYVYATKVVVSTFFRAMYFPHNESIVTVDQLEFVDPSHYPTLDQVYHLSIPSVSIDITPPRVNYVGSYLSCPITTEKNPL